MKNLNYINLNQIKSNTDGEPTVNRQSRLMSYRGNLRNLAMIFAVLVMSIANIGMAWGGQNLYNGYIKATFNGTKCWGDTYYEMYSGGPNATLGTAAQMGTLTGDFVITDVKLKFNTDWDTHKSEHQCWYNVDGSGGSDYWISWGTSKGDGYPEKLGVNYTIARHTDASGYHSVNVGFQSQIFWNKDEHHTLDLKTYYFSYTVLPPAVSSFTVTPTGAVSGDGTEGNPYIIPYGGDLKLTMSGSQGHSDANSSAKYYNTSSASSWTTRAYKTISNVTETSNQSVTIKMCYENNSSSELHGTESTKTVYYKAAKGVSLYKFQTKSSGLGTDAICANKDQDYSLTTGGSGKLETLIGGTLKARASSAGTTNLVYNTSNIKFTGGNAGWLILGLDNKIKSGDVIRYINSNSGSVAIRTAKDASTNQIVLAGNSKTTMQTVVITDAQASAFASLNTVYMIRTSNTSEISYFEILRPLKVTLNANTNGGKVGGENTQTRYFVADEAQLLPRATKSDYLFKGWFDASSGGDAVANPYTATTSPKTLYAQFDDCSSTAGTVYKFQLKTGLDNSSITAGDLNVGNYLSAMDGGTAVITGSHAKIVNNSAIDFNDNGDYITVNLDCELKAGDFFKTTISGSKSGIKVTTTSSTTSLKNISFGTNVETEVPASLVGKKTFRIYRQDSNCGGLSYFEITRPSGYAVTYNNGGHGTAPDNTTASSVTLTDISTGDWINTGWKANVATTVGGEAVAENTLIANGSVVTLSGATTFTAQWTECSGPSYTAFTPTGVTDGSHNVGDDLGTLSVTAAPQNGGTLSYQWYQYDDATGKVNATVAAGTNNAATYNIPNNAECTNRHYYCVISESGCSTTVESAISGALTLTEALDPCSEPAEVTNEIARFFVPCGTSTSEAYTVTNQLSSTGDNKFSTYLFGGGSDNWDKNATTGFIYGKLTDSNGYIQIKLNEGSFQAGDIINAYFNSNNTNNNLKLKSGSGNELGAASASGLEYVRTYTLTAADIEDNGSIKFFRKGSSIRVNRIIVTRPPVSATITATKTSPDYVSPDPNNLVLSISTTGASSGWYYRVKNTGTSGYQTPDEVAYNTATWTMTSGLALGANNFVVELYNGSGEKQAESATITVTAETAYSMTIAAGAGGSVSPSGEIKANESGNHIHPEITATPASGYHFVSWTKDNENATLENANAATTTITSASGACTITANFAADECTPTTLFSMVVADSGSDADVARQGGTLSLTTSNHLSTLTGGTATLKNNYASSGSAHKMVGKDNDERHLRFKQNDHLLIVTLDEALAEGDIISFTGYGSNQLSFTTTETRATTPATSSKSYTIPSASGLIGATTIYIWRSSGSDTYIKSLTVTRPCDETCKTPNITNIASTTNMTTAETKSLNVTLGNADALTGTVSYAWTNSDGTAIAAAAKATGTTTARLTLTEPAAGTYTFKCTVTNDCGGDGSQSATSAVFTVKVTASAGCTEIAKVIVSGTSTGTDSGTKIAETGGYGVKLESTTASHGGNTGYKIGSNNYVYLQLASGEQFQNGDKVKVYITKVSDQGDHKLHIFQGTTAAGTEVATVETPVLGWNEATLSNVTTGNRSLTIHRSSGTTEQNHYIYAFAVERCKDCSPATFEGMSYDETEYTVGASASAITVTNPENADSYQWYYNTVNDRSDATKTEETGATSASFTPSTTAAFATRYYWCELTNDCGTVKTPTVGITVRASKSNPTVTWTNPSSVNYGGGGYTIRATVDQTTWDGTLTASMLTAPTGIAITNVTIGADAGKKYIEVRFDVQTSFDTETYGSTIPFVLSLPETTNYNELVSEKDLTYSACAGGGDSDNSYVIGYSNADATNVSSSAAFRAYNTASNWYSAGNTTFTDMTSTDGFSISATNKSGYYWKNDGSFTTSGSSDNRLITLKLAKNNGATIRWTNEALSFTKIRIIGRNTSSDESSTFTVSNGTTEKTFTFESGSSIIQTKEVVMDFVAGSEKGVVISGGTKELNVLIELVPASGGGTLTTTLAFASAGPLNKQTSDANFTNTASVTGANSNTLGTITYSSNHPEIASVNTATGEVTLVAAGTAVITATLSRSGCYKSATASYTINVTEVTCEEPAGVIAVTSGSTEVCSVPVGLTLTHIEGATVQWYNGDAEISNGGDYTITAPTETTSVLSTTTPGNYSAKAYKECEKAAAKRSNTIKVVSAASEVDVTPIIEKWYIKNGRPTPDIALWQLGEGTSLKSVAWSPANATGLTAAGDIYEQEGIVYLTGKEPSANTGADIEYTLTLTVKNSCGSETVMSGKTITIVHQKNTDKHVLAFVVGNTEKKNNKYVAIGKGFTESIPASQTTNVPLYNAIANNFAVQPTNIYSTDDEKKLKEYYSQYDILCITDYPNTGTKGVNGKSYVDAIGSLIDIRPILTMEAYVSGLANWRSKGVVGTRTTPTRRQYNMLLQCKDHEIFSGTSPETLGEGDDIMYRVNMVDSTQSRYAELDAVGKSSHATDTAALQGFTTGEMDLLALGLIDNGSGTDLQVGAERQTNMKARMMVLGINSYAMERLSNDGETVVINALNYLMKKNAEDIEDCSNYFLGGASGDARNWHNVANWSGATLPDKTQEVRILAPCEIKNGQKAHVARVKIVPNGNYKSVPVTGGSLTIAAGGALVVDGKVQAATAPNYYEARPTSAADLTIGSTETNGNGTLIFDNEDGSTQAIVQYYSKATTDEAETWYWQYMAVPFNDNSSAYRNYYDSYLYRWNTECTGWEVVPNRGEVYPWVGYTITQEGNKTYTMDGTLVETGEQVFSIPAGKNLVLGNSWTAPIQVKQFTDDDFAHMSKNVYLFNTGYDPNGGGEFDKAGGRYEGGTYVTIPIHSSPYTGDSLISSLQAFIVYAKTGEGGGTFTLDYDRHVRPARSTDKVNAGPMHAPKRGGAIDDKPAVLKVWASGSRYDDRLIVLEREDFSTGLDEGWDGNKRVAGNSSPLIFAVTDNGREAVSAIPTMEGTLIGFWAGEDNEYTLHFEYNEEDELYLLDLDNNTYTPVNSSSTYVFTVPDKKAHNRFILTRIAPDPVATGVEETQASEKPEAKAIKFLKDEKVFIFVNGKLYDATGKVVK